MNELSCRVVQRWLQAPAELVPRDAHRLERHVRTCTACRAIQQQTIAVDRLLHETFSQTPVRSVRSGVRATLMAERQAEPSSWRVRWLGMMRAALPLVAVATVLALILTQLLPDATGNQPVAGAAWHPIRADIGFAIGADARVPNHLLAGASGQVYESWNAGDNWQALGALPRGVVLMSVAVDRTRPSRYLASTLHSIYVSDDRGRHWRITADSLQGARNMFLIQSPGPSGTFYVGPSILWRSVDHGDSWAPAGQGSVFAPYGIQALSATSNGTLYTAIWGGGVAMSRDGGVSWQQRTQGLQPDAMDVTRSADGMLWAATRNGPYSSADGGLHWRSTGPSHPFWTTSVLTGAGFVLAGGDGVMYRSVDHGKSWDLATTGLPLAPYVNSLTADPFHAGRVFASLNTDGLFRSDDGGQHWTAVNNGLTLTSSTASSHMMLFIRGGTLWQSKTTGIDPGSLSVENGIRLAALSPDGASVAYLEDTHGSWAVRLLSAGGSAAHTLLAGDAAAPQRLLWSPDSLRLAIATASMVTITQQGQSRHVLSLVSGEHLVGWTGDGRALLVWNARTHDVTAHSWRTGVLLSLPFRYAGRPHPAPDGLSLAYIRHGSLYVGSWTTGARAVARVAARCVLRGWSDDSSRLLLVCGNRGKIVSRHGSVVRVVVAPGARWMSWMPGSSHDVLVYRGGIVWHASAFGPMVRLMRDARPVTSAMAAS